jgi:hypothetical protein
MKKRSYSTDAEGYPSASEICDISRTSSRFALIEAMRRRHFDEAPAVLRAAADDKATRARRIAFLVLAGLPSCFLVLQALRRNSTKR